MFKHPIVKPAFHLSWFLLLLGGVSLLEKGGWGIVGAIMCITGLAVLGFTAAAIYMHKKIVKEPGWILLFSLGLLLVLIVAEVIFGKYIVAVILAVLSMPVLMGWTKIKGQRVPDKSAVKGKS